jgi:hypothetical protein
MNMAWDKTPSQKDAVKAFLVTQDGKADLELSVEKYRAVCRQYIAGQTAEQDLIGQCMTELFDFRKGAFLNLDYIKSQTVQRMAQKHPDLGEPTLFAMLSGRVEDYLHENCNQPAVEAKGNKPAKEAVTGKTYQVRKGLGGGFCRVADQPAEKV